MEQNWPSYLQTFDQGGSQLVLHSKASEFDQSGRTSIILQSIIPLFFSLLSNDVQILFLSHWLDIRSLVTLDMAITSAKSRQYWMKLLHSVRAGVIDDWGHSISSLRWLTKRGIHATRVCMKVDTRLVRGCDLILLETDEIVHLGLSGCCNLTEGL